MAICPECDGEGEVCDECGGKGPIRLTEYGNCCQKCAEELAEEDHKRDEEFK